MAVFKCKMCGADLEIVGDSKVCECDYCGSTQTVPSLDNEKKINLFARANRLRMACEFDKAAGVYESIVSEFQDEAEAYWGLILCKYGIEYVDDPKTGKKIPTCHRSSFDSVLEESNFEMVMECGDIQSRLVYREEAKAIEKLRTDIIEVSSKEEPYDIFICYKETDENGDRTIDSVIAQDVYDELTEKGYKVFFSRISLEDKLGQEYEPYIFAALNSAKIMLAFGTNYEYYNAVWVKNEWSRFLSLIEKGEKKTLIPCYKDIDAYDMPNEFKRLQAQDMGKVGAVQDLIRGIQKIIGVNQLQVIKETAVVQQGNVSDIPNALIKRGNMALEDGEWQKADEFFEEALNKDAECAEAYLGKLLAKCKRSNMPSLVQYYISKYESSETEDLEACEEATSRIETSVSQYMVLDYLSDMEIRKQYTFNRTYVSELSFRKTQKSQALSELSSEKLLLRAQQYAMGETKTIIDKMLADITFALDARISDAEKKDSDSIASVKSAYEMYLNDADLKVLNLYDQALEKQESTYRSRVSQMKVAKFISDYEKVRDLFNEMNGYKDTVVLADECQVEIDKLKEEKRQELESYEELRRKAAERSVKKRKLIVIIVSTVAAICIVAFMVATRVIIPNGNYNTAVTLMNNGEYQKAISIFETLGGYKDSNNQIEICKDNIYIIAMDFMKNGEFEKALSTFEGLGEYKDSNNQIKICNEKMAEIEYNAAMEYMNNGMYIKALSMFEVLGDYKDSNELFVQAELKLLSDASVGDVVRFGNYGDNMTWIVLAKEDEKVFVICKWAIAEKPYNAEYTSVTWESCTLRKWLNENFLTSFFNNDEQARIIETTNINSNNFTYGGNNTIDKIFLLSIDEFKEYITSDINDELCGVYNGQGITSWWLRSPGDGFACETSARGSVLRNVEVNASSGVGVRPAMWIDISDL